MATNETVGAKAKEYRRLYIWVQAQPLEERWRYGADLKAARAEYLVEKEELGCSMR